MLCGVFLSVFGRARGLETEHLFYEALAQNAISKIAFLDLNVFSGSDPPLSLLSMRFVEYVLLESF